jgi:pyridoxal phosphate enzyme (YggS family)
MNIENRILELKENLPQKVRLVAVSKTKAIPEIMEAYNVGQRIFGENKVQELIEKHEVLPKDIEWHMIGHLQTNKIRYISPFVKLIHGVDSFKLLRELDKEGRKLNRVLNCLLQVKIAKEETKFGLSKTEIVDILLSEEFKTFRWVQIQGLMGMATYTDDLEIVRNEFRTCRQIFKELKERFFADSDEFAELSMGMSDDYLIAIEEGATMVRLGSTIFGERVYL